jgi:hypothetical protein
MGSRPSDRETTATAAMLPSRPCRKSQKAAKLRIVPLSTRSVNLANGCGSRIGRDEAALVHWVQIAAKPPSWARRASACKGGRGSRVSQPSEAQRRFEIRKPRYGQRTSLQMIVGAPASSAPWFGLGLQRRDRSRATPSTLRVQRRAGEFEPAGQAFYATGKHNQQPPTLRRLMNGEGKRA